MKGSNEYFLEAQEKLNSNKCKIVGEEMMFRFVSAYLDIIFLDYKWLLINTPLKIYIEDYKQDLQSKFFDVLKRKSFDDYKQASYYLRRMSINLIFDELRRNNKRQFFNILDKEITNIYIGETNDPNLFYPEDIISFLTPFFNFVKKGLKSDDQVIFDSILQNKNLVEISKDLSYSTFIPNSLNKKINRAKRRIAQNVLILLEQKNNSDFQYEIRILKKLLDKNHSKKLKKLMGNTN
jgi:hypothetical protein